MSDLILRLSTALADRYRIERELGAGGMATVYLAEDVKHHRRVALKVLRPELAAVLGAERFVQEIETTANLQHPNILPLYDSGEADTFLYYVMPYIEGESLRDKLNREKQLSVEETVGIAKSVAAALQFAHERDVIHRDIKPENILLQSGQALVADFGIALAVSQAGGTRLTETGLSLGTPHYMSPEQATADRDLTPRSDVYSLGCVVYEMLVGDPPHLGSSAQAIIAKIISEKPSPIAKTRDAVPHNVQVAVRMALEKTPADRFPTAMQFAEALTNPAFRSSRFDEAVPPATPRGLLRYVWPAATLAAVLLGLWSWMRPQGGPSVARVQISLPENQRLAISGGGAYPLDLSRDGSRLVYLGEQDGVRRLFLRTLSDLTVQALPGTDGARQPFFSSDGEWVGFFANNQLQRVAISGGAPISITELPPGLTGGASWGADGTILFAAGASLYLVPAAGGDPIELDVTFAGPEPGAVSDDPSMNNATEGRVRWPHHLPDGDHALVTVTAGTFVLNLRTRDTRFLFSGIQARYLPTGHLIFHAGQERIRVVPFALDRLEITGPEAPALENVFRGPANGAANFVVSQTGTLVYVAGGFDRSLWLVDRDGRETPIDVAPRGYRFPTFSPDGNNIAVTVDPRPSDIWVIDRLRSSATPITSGVHSLEAAWGPAGARLTFVRDGDQHWIDWREGGEPQRVASRPLAQYSPSWSPTDLIVVFETTSETGADLITLNLTDGTSTPFLVTPADESHPRLSPDGRWVAYNSNVSGMQEVYVLSFPEPGARHLVSNGGGTDGTWSSDGTELFYRSGNRILAVDVQATSTFTAGEPRDLFSGPYDFTQTNNWDVGPDGRFVMVKGDPSTFRQFQVVLNWFEEVEGRR